MSKALTKMAFPPSLSLPPDSGESVSWPSTRQHTLDQYSERCVWSITNLIIINVGSSVVPVVYTHTHTGSWTHTQKSVTDDLGRKRQGMWAMRKSFFLFFSFFFKKSFLSCWLWGTFTHLFLLSLHSFFIAKGMKTHSCVHVIHCFVHGLPIVLQCIREGERERERGSLKRKRETESIFSQKHWILSVFKFLCILRSLLDQSQHCVGEAYSWK